MIRNNKLAALLIAVMFTFYMNIAEAAPFGGRSTVVLACTCDMSFIITLDNYANGATENFIYSPLSTSLYMNFLFAMPGVYMLGIASDVPSECMQLSASGCTPTGQFGYPMEMLGTSLAG